MGYEIREIRYRRATLNGSKACRAARIHACRRGKPYDFPDGGGATLLANLALLPPFSCLDARKGAKEDQGYGLPG